MLLLIWKCIHMIQVCIILSSEWHFDKGLLGFDRRVSIWHRCEWYISQCCVLFACVLSSDTMIQVLQNVLKQRSKTVNWLFFLPEWSHGTAAYRRLVWEEREQGGGLVQLVGSQHHYLVTASPRQSLISLTRVRWGCLTISHHTHSKTIFKKQKVVFFKLRLKSD